MPPQLARAGVRIGAFVALTSGVLAFVQPRGSAEQAISLFAFLLSLFFLAGIIVWMRRV